MKFERDHIIFSDGSSVYAFQYKVGLAPDGSIVYGSDGILHSVEEDAYEKLNEAHQIEIADYMIQQWQALRDKLQPSKLEPYQQNLEHMFSRRHGPKSVPHEGEGVHAASAPHEKVSISQFISELDSYNRKLRRPEPTQEQLDQFIERAGFACGWGNLESGARRMAQQAVSELNEASAFQCSLGAGNGSAFPPESLPTDLVRENVEANAEVKAQTEHYRAINQELRDRVTNLAIRVQQFEKAARQQAKSRPEFLSVAEQCGARIIGNPNASEPIEIIFSIQAWRSFDAAIAARAAQEKA